MTVSGVGMTIISFEITDGDYWLKPGCVINLVCKIIGFIIKQASPFKVEKNR
jgi:hypothetical protein